MAHRLKRVVWWDRSVSLSPSSFIVSIFFFCFVTRHRVQDVNSLMVWHMLPVVAHLMPSISNHRERLKKKHTHLRALAFWCTQKCGDKTPLSHASFFFNARRRTSDTEISHVNVFIHASASHSVNIYVNIRGHLRQLTKLSLVVWQLASHTTDPWLWRSV